MNQLKKTPFLMALLTLWLASCSMVGPISTTIGVPQPLVKPQRDISVSTQANVDSATFKDSPVAKSTQFFKTPAVPAPASGAANASPLQQPLPNANDETVSAVSLDGLPLPQFINTIYATVLKRNVSLDPAVQSRTDLVSLRTGKPQSAAQMSATAASVLRAYGVSVNEFEGLVRVVPSTGAAGVSPEIIRGRAQPDIPGPLRPIFYLVELERTTSSTAMNWVRTMFQSRLSITEDPQRNAIMLSGQSDSVMAAVEAIHILDQPRLRGRFSARVTPIFWSATDLAGRLVEMLAAEGYSASASNDPSMPILILPIAAVNSVAVFAVSEDALDHVLRWARELDQIPPASNGGRFITYYVRNTDAAAVAKTLQDVLGGGASATPAAAPVAGAGASATRLPGGSRVVVNAAANSIIIQSTPAEYPQIYGLLQELDRPARSALIMATVAEVSLSDQEQFGFNWLLSQFTAGGYRINGGMGPVPAGTATSASGLALNIASIAGDPRALLTALATSSRVRVLSNPSVIAINGQTATIQVGQDVPILTSQISNSNTGTGTGQGVLQTVQYRNVGIILKVKPVVYSGGRVDLDLTQEVSGVSTASTGLGNSPVVNTRRVDTRLSMMDGNTMLIGGLISEQRDGSNSGLPYLKDIPLVGALFRSDGSSKVVRTELVLLVTTHLIEDDFDSRAITEAFRSQFSWGKEIPLAVKLPSKLPALTGPVGSTGEPSRAEISEPYVLPAKPIDLPVLQSKRPSAQDGRSQAMAPAQSEPATAPATPAPDLTPATGKPMADDALRRELMEAIHKSK